jgi:hypothetical protein
VHTKMISNQLTSLCTFVFTFSIGFGLRDITIPSPYLCTVLSASCTHVQLNFKILKKMWLLCLPYILMLPSSILRTVLGPLNLYKPYGLIPELFDFSVQNAHRTHLKSVFLLHLNHIPINNMISIRYIFI